MSAAQASLVLVKPDAGQHGLMGAVLTRLEETKLRLIGANE